MIWRQNVSRKPKSNFTDDVTRHLTKVVRPHDHPNNANSTLSHGVRSSQARNSILSFTTSLETGSLPLQLHLVAVSFVETSLTDVYALRTNKVLADFVKSPRFSELEAVVRNHYSDFLDLPVGKFVAMLKGFKDPFYREFLNHYGDLSYCTLRIIDADHARQKGIYMFTIGQSPRYIGRCRDSFGKRINQGFGRIKPENCYANGQPTNCHLNALIAEHHESVNLYVLPLEDSEHASVLERDLVRKYAPDWNRQIVRGT